MAERDRFLEECIADPSLRDKMSILSRTFKNKKKVGLCLNLPSLFARALNNTNNKLHLCPSKYLYSRCYVPNLASNIYFV